MKINIDKKVLRYFFVLATIAVLFPPFYVIFLENINDIKFSFLLAPPRHATEGVVVSLLTVEIIASFLMAHIINFIVINTPKRILYGILTLILFYFIAVAVSLYYR